MKITAGILLAFVLQCYAKRTHALPTTRQVLLGQVDIAVQEQPTNDVTTETYLRECVVDGTSYSHSQTIPSYDSSSHCLCVAGEVYCWWQNYNRDANVPLGSTTSTTTTTTTTTESVDSYEASGELAPEYAAKQRNPDVNGTLSTRSSTCLVMGRVYQQGEVLPHSTGNCVECSCGTEGRIECSPRDCVALRLGIPVLPDVPEIPDGNFEVFNIEQDRGIDGSF